jgi:hypothetical protein
MLSELQWGQTWGMRSSGFRRRLRSYRAWWPFGLAVAGTFSVVLVEAVRPTGDDRSVAGPLVVVCAIAALAGVVTGVTMGLIQASAPVELRIRMALVVLSLVTAVILDGGPLVAGLSAPIGSGVALGSAWCGRRIMSALLPPPDDTRSDSTGERP